jgi:hypothetical protein
VRQRYVSDRAGVQTVQDPRDSRSGPAAIQRNARNQIDERHIDPDGTPSRCDQRAIVRVHEGAAAGRDDDVAERLQQTQDVALDRTKVRLALLREDFGDGAALALFDELVDVFVRQPSRVASARATVLLPLAMNPTR